jgi:tetratricopeptide (TPR) repeat protein
MLKGMAVLFARNQRILVKIRRHSKPESAASTQSFSYSACVFRIQILAKSATALVIIACSACVGGAWRPKAESSEAPPVFYTVTAEVALSRHEVRVAALEYAAATEASRDVSLLARAAEVTAQCLQPSLTALVATRWIDVDPAAVDAHRAAARADLELYRIDQSAAQYRIVLTTSPRGLKAEFAALETELAAAANVYGARQVADRLVGYFPASAPALRLQAYAALRADDPVAAAHSFAALLAANASAAPEPPGTAPADAAPAATPSPAAPPDAAAPNRNPPDAPAEGTSAAALAPAEVERRELTQGLWRARILAGDSEEPLAQAKALAEGGTVESRLDYALLLLAAQQDSAARAQFTQLTNDPDARPVALRLLGLIDFQGGELDEAGARFAELVTTGRFLDDAIYYLGLIAERHQDFERALRLYAQVQSGDNAVAALLRAATILRAHGAAPAAEQILEQLVTEEPQRAPEILTARAHMYADDGDVAQAMAVLAQAQIEYPDSVDLRYAFASMSDEQGKSEAALRVLKEIAHERPGDPAALNAYGYTLADNNRRLGAARKLIEKAYVAAPRNPAILDSLGWVLFRQGHVDQALPYLKTAYADERDGDIAAHLGEVLWRLDRRSDAERIWAEAGRSDADNHLLKATLQRLHASK